MTESTKPYLRAYYHEFTITGCPAVDGVLEAIALAGKAYHHTADWGDEEKYGPDGYWGLIQLRADAAADVFKSVSALPAVPAAVWLEAMARGVCKQQGWGQCAAICLSELHPDGQAGKCPHATTVWGRQVRAAYAALARAMGGGDAE